MTEKYILGHVLGLLLFPVIRESEFKVNVLTLNRQLSSVICDFELYATSTLSVIDTTQCRNVLLAPLVYVHLACCTIMYVQSSQDAETSHAIQTD